MIRACLDGDRGAWEALIRRCGALIYSVPRRAGLSERDAAGVFQEVCRDLWRGLPEVCDHPKPGAWLITVAARHTLGRLQRRRR
ncbi:MAG: hypothetical protein HYY05_08415, partial [Chloroflexi bacterium]|nr:hypothetical protein [Chloroflexota bacterium]